ncbi:hypothetical protein pb186bvf_016079 [Paramecium bursaria]
MINYKPDINESRKKYSDLLMKQQQKHQYILMTQIQELFLMLKSRSASSIQRVRLELQVQLR